MDINGKWYQNPDIQLKELKLAVDRLPLNYELQPHFDFLFGYIDALQGQAVNYGDMEGKLDEAEQIIDAAKENVASALSDLGETAPDDFEKALELLIELATTKDADAPALVSRIDELLLAKP